MNSTPQVVDITSIAVIISFFIPLLVSVLAKKTASDGLKAVINLVATAIASAVALWLNPHDGPITWALALNTFFFSLAASLVSYKGVLKPTGIAGSVANATAGFGLGSPPTLETSSKGAEEAPGDPDLPLAVQEDPDDAADVSTDATVPTDQPADMALPEPAPGPGTSIAGQTPPPNIDQTPGVDLEGVTR